jgi:tetratricopeptide (TPR) repeat protein
MKDILELESDIAKLIADKLQAAISPEEKQLIEKVHTHNTEAYDYYLMGRYYWNLRTLESNKKSIEYFEKAINADSTYALAYAGLADTYYDITKFMQKPIKNYDKAIELAKKALEIDKNLPEAYAVLGAVYANGFWQWERSGKYFEKAMKIDSNNMVTLYYYSIWLNTTGEFDTSRKYINRTLEFAPYSVRFRRSSSYFYYNENKSKEALQEILMVEGMLGDKSAQQDAIFQRYLSAGDTVSALQYMQRNFATNPAWKEFKGLADQVFPVYQSSGLKGIYQMMVKKPPNCWWAVQMDSLDLTIKYLEEAYGNRNVHLIEWVLDPDFKKLHNDPRFLEIVDKTGLTPYFNKRYKK